MIAHGLSAYSNEHCRCEVCVTAWNAYAAARRARPDICQDCSEPPVEGKKRCQRHLDSALVRQARLKLRRQRPIQVSPVVVYCLRVQQELRRRTERLAR